MENKEVIEQLTKTVTTLSSLVDEMSDNHNKMFSSQGNYKAEINHIREDLKGATERITKIIAVLHEGNGQPPLVTRVAVLEQQSSEGAADIGRLYDRIEAINERDNLRVTGEVSSKKMTKELIGAVVSSIAAIIAAISAAT